VAVKKVAWILVLVAGCGSPAFIGGAETKEDAGRDARADLVVHEADADAGSDEPDVVVPDPCESCQAPEFGAAVCVDGACDFTCPATCTKTGDGCDCPPAQCCDDEQCGGVSCNRGQCSGTYTTCDESRCWAWCTRCLSKSGGHCPPLHPTEEVFCECTE
jgi:hypothetical protein